MSEDDDLLSALGHVARERAQDPEASPRPLDDLTRARIADDIVAHLRPAAKQRPRWSRWTWAAGGFAAAAAIALFLRSRGSEVDPLPRYAVSASGASVVRGPTAPVEGCRLRASEQGGFEIVAQPSEPVRGRGPVGAQAFVVHGSRGEVEPSPVSIEASEQGSIRVTGASRLLLGSSELRLVLGRVTEVRSDAASRHATSASDSGPGWQTIRCPIEK